MDCLMVGPKIASDKKTKVKEYGRTKPVWKVFKLLENFVDPTIHKLAMKWYKELENLKENFLCWMILIVIHIQSIEIKSSITPSINVTKGTWDINRQFKKIELDDFVIDQHTYEGRSKGIGSATFVSIGALVIPESNYVIPEFKRFYEEFKSGAIQGASLESSYTFLVRAQLTTSASKSDVYFAKDPLGQLVVVKGPLKSIKEAEFMLDMQEWKKNHKIPYLNATCEWLVMDRWLQGVPLGLRNTLDRQKPHPFLIIKSEVPENAILNNKKLHQSNLWPPTEVVDWNKVPLHLNIDHLTPQEWNDYVTALLMRYVFGISDLADRNFLMVNGRVISIDEEINSRNVSFMVELKKTKCATIHEWLKLHYDELSLDWEIPEEALDKLTIIQKKEKCMALFK